MCFSFNKIDKHMKFTFKKTLNLINKQIKKEEKKLFWNYCNIACGGSTIALPLLDCLY